MYKWLVLIFICLTFTTQAMEQISQDAGATSESASSNNGSSLPSSQGYAPESDREDALNSKTEAETTPAPITTIMWSMVKSGLHALYASLTGYNGATYSPRTRLMFQMIGVATLADLLLLGYNGCLFAIIQSIEERCRSTLNQGPSKYVEIPVTMIEKGINILFYERMQPPVLNWHGNLNQSTLVATLIKIPLWLILTPLWLKFVDRYWPVHGQFLLPPKPEGPCIIKTQNSTQDSSIKP
jgi:hypothetical protein